VRLERLNGRPLIIGHKGAAALEPENTLRSLARAVELGVDLIEFDVIDLADGTLVLAHSDDLLEVSHGAAAGRVRSRTLESVRSVAPELPTFEEALDFFVERTLVSSPVVESLHRVAEVEPALSVGLTYPFDRRGVSLKPVLAALVVGRWPGYGGRFRAGSARSSPTRAHQWPCSITASSRRQRLPRPMPPAPPSSRGRWMTRRG